MVRLGSLEGKCLSINFSTALGEVKDPDLIIGANGISKF